MKTKIVVNFSYFDKPFFDGMFGNDFVFPDEEGTRPHWDGVSAIQKRFMVWFNEERLKTLFTFPVESFALVYKDDKFVDEETADFVAEEYARGHSFFTYMSDTVDSLSSCCFDGKTQVMYIPQENIEGDFLIENIEDAYRKHSNEKIKVYQETISEDGKSTCGEWKDAEFVKAEAIQEVDIYLEPLECCPSEAMNVIKVTPDHIFPILKDGKIVEKHAYLIESGDELMFEKTQLELQCAGENMGDVVVDGPQEVVTRKVSKVYVNDIEVKDFYCFKIVDENSQPYFLMPNGVITHNCRLKNKIQTKEFNFTNGNMGVQTGSKSVITLNLSRIVQDWYASLCKKYENVDKSHISFYYDEMKEYFKPILERVYKYHTAYNELLWDLYDAGLLPVYSAGFISLDKQYLTIGLNGLNAAAEFLGMECTDNEYYSEFCQTLFGYIKQENAAHKCKYNGHQLTFNTECVPAESLAVKNYNWDKEDGYWVPEDLNLYASYIFKPNDAKMTLWEKIRLHGNRFIGDFLDGGSAAHLNLEAHLPKSMIKKVMLYCAKHGCQYWTFNIPNAKCEDCGYIAKHPFDVCPKCGSRNVSLYDRIIGYMTKIANWSAGRLFEQRLRIYLALENISEKDIEKEFKKAA